jgi:hypothetical protein
VSAGILFLPLVLLLVVGMVRFCVLSAAGARQVADPGGAARLRLRLTGIALLAAGGFAAVLIFVRTLPQSDLPPEIIPKSTKASEYEMERIGGKVNGYTAELRDEFGDLWQGRELAYTVAVFSFVGCVACFFLAHDFAAHPAAATEREER